MANKSNEFSMPTKSEVFFLWLGTQKNMAEATLKAYSTDLDDFATFMREEYQKDINQPENITKKDVQNYLAYLHTNKYSKTSVSRKLSSLRAYFNYCTRKEYIKLSPLANIKNPKQAKFHPNVPSKEQVIHILDENQNIQKEKTLDAKKIAIINRDIALLELLYGSGLRISEALALNIQDFSEQKAHIIVLGKGNKQRIVPLTSKSIDAITKWLKHYQSILNTDNTQFLTAYQQALFIGVRAKRLNRREALRIIDKMQKQVGTPHLSAHSFRHAYATHLLESGLDLRTVQELLGHARIATTQMYTHLNLKHLIEVYNKAHPESE